MRLREFIKIYTTNISTRKKPILHLLFIIANNTCRIEKHRRHFSCNSVIQLPRLFQDFKLCYQSHCSKDCYWSSHPQHVLHCTCITDLAGSSITYINELSSAQPRCLLKGQHDGMWIILKISGCLKSPRACHGEVSSIWRLFEASATTYSVGTYICGL